tara:strand:- start:415 stop:2196 length:1782 start_codon:yes stop_codon:yes gene_type:complete
MSQLNSLLESANPYKSLQSDAARLASKWAKTGLLEGLSDNESNNMSMLLENQAKQLVTETSNTGGGAAAGNFTPGTGAQWAGVALPLVRKVFGQIAAKEFVSVQPMNLPSGLVFFLDFQYGTTKDPFTSGQSMYGTRVPAAANPAAAGGAAGFENNSTGGLYGAGRFSYSSNLTGALDVVATITSASWSDLNYDGLYSSGSADPNATGQTIDYGSGFTSYNVVTIPAGAGSAVLAAAPDFEAVRSFTFYSQSSVVATGVGNPGNIATLPAFTKNVYSAAGAITGIQFVVPSGSLGAFTFANTAASAGQPFLSSISFSQQPTDSQRGDFEDGNTNLNANNATINIPQVNVQMTSEAIVAKTRKLRAVWTPEFAQDLNAYHSLDAEAELTSIMSEYISLEIDLEILDMLIESAASTENWSAKNNINVAQDAAGTETNLGFYNSQGQWFQTLGTKIQKISNIIHQKTLRGGANFLVCSPTVGTVLESIPGFAAASNGDAAQMNYAFGVQKVGSLNGRYQVYKNPYMTENQVLLGYRGTQFLEAGAVFAPYVPLIMTPMVYDPTTFTPRKGLLTRYAKKMLRPEYYGVIKIAGLETL